MTEQPFLGRPAAEHEIAGREYSAARSVPVTVTRMPWGLQPVAVVSQGDGLMSVAELPQSITADAVRVREGEYDVLALLEGRWYHTKWAMYVDKQPGETDADVVERLGLDEESLLPYRTPGE